MIVALIASLVSLVFSGVALLMLFGIIPLNQYTGASMFIMLGFIVQMKTKGWERSYWDELH